MKQRNNAYRVALSGLLVALMLVLGYVESMIPLNIGVPGIKLGLSNGVLIFAVYMLDVPLAYCLMSLKVLLSGLMFGGVSAMLYAFAGGLLSLTVMCLLSRFKSIRTEVVSMVGGVMHNVGQVGLAMLILHTDKLLYYMAVLMLVGLACGLLTGVCARAVMNHLGSGALRGLKPTQDPKGRWVAVAVALVLAAVTAAVAVINSPNLKPRPAVTVTFELDSDVKLPVP